MGNLLKKYTDRKTETETENLPAVVETSNNLLNKAIDKPKAGFWKSLGKLFTGKVSPIAFMVSQFPKTSAKFVNRFLSGGGKMLQKVFPVLKDKPAQCKLVIHDEHTVTVTFKKDENIANLLKESLKFFPEAFVLDADGKDRPELDCEIRIDEKGGLYLKFNKIEFNAQEEILNKLSDPNFGKEFENAEKEFEKEVVTLLPPENENPLLPVTT